MTSTFSTRNALVNNFSFDHGCLLRLAEFGDSFFLIVSVARDCRNFATMKLCTAPNIFVPKSVLHGVATS